MSEVVRVNGEASGHVEVYPLDGCVSIEIITSSEQAFITLTPIQTGDLIRALAVARVELSKEPPR